jgi:hypothetical protein
MKNRDQINAYLDSRDRLFNFLGSLAKAHPESSDEHNILSLACHAILFCHTRERHDAFKKFLTKSSASEAERAYFDKIGFSRGSDIIPHPIDCGDLCIEDGTDVD